MLIDSLANFLSPGSPALAITAAATYTSNVIDLLGSGVGTPPANIIGNATLFGEDAGIGRVRPQTQAVVGTTFVGGTNIQMKFQAAPDVAVTHVPTTWTTLVETGLIVTADLVSGAIIGRFDYPPAVPAGLRPRFLRIAFVSVGVFTAGDIASIITTMVRDDYSIKFQPNNYVVA